MLTQEEYMDVLKLQRQGFPSPRSPTSPAITQRPSRA